MRTTRVGFSLRPRQRTSKQFAPYHTQPLLLAKRAKKKDTKGKKIKLSEKETYDRSSILFHKDSPSDYISIPNIMARLPVDVDAMAISAAEMMEDLKNLTNPVFRRYLSKQCRTAGGIWAIFPHILDNFYPRINLIVEYPQDSLAYYGNELPYEICVHKPKVSIQIPFKGIYWTLVFLGQDVLHPDRQTLHGLWVNMMENMDTADEIVSYIPPVPLGEGAALHRYVWFLCSQEGIQFKNPSRDDFGLPENLSDFKLRKLLELYPDIVIPKGFCFFHIRSHDYVPEAAQLFQQKNYPGSNRVSPFVYTIKGRKKRF